MYGSVHIHHARSRSISRTKSRTDSLICVKRLDVFWFSIASCVAVSVSAPRPAAVSRLPAMRENIGSMMLARLVSWPSGPPNRSSANSLASSTRTTSPSPALCIRSASRLLPLENGSIVFCRFAWRNILRHISFAKMCSSLHSAAGGSGMMLSGTSLKDRRWYGPRRGPVQSCTRRTTDSSSSVVTITPS